MGRLAGTQESMWVIIRPELRDDSGDGEEGTGSRDPSQVDGTGSATPRDGRSMELLQDKMGRGGEGGTEQGGHGRRGKGFSGAGVWEWGEDLRRY